ncbi:MAG: hypothetical protein KL787_05355 [Taibaiella sp.]|nr:hypothetical protein [Taibaiella sp.]
MSFEAKGYKKESKQNFAEFYKDKFIDTWNIVSEKLIPFKAVVFTTRNQIEGIERALGEGTLLELEIFTEEQARNYINKLSKHTNKESGILSLWSVLEKASKRK